MGLKAESADNYHRFIQGAIENNSVWFLVHGENHDPMLAASHNQEGRYVIPFWSDAVDAERHLNKEFKQAGYVAAAVDLLQFVFHILPQYARNAVLIGTNWNADLAGLEVEPDVLCNELVKAINKTRNNFPEKLNDLEYCQALIVRLAQALAYHTIETETSLPYYEGQAVENYLQTEIIKAKSLIQEAGLNIDELYPPEIRPEGKI